MPAFLGVIGRKGSGKVEGLTSLIACLKKGGVRIGVVKHIAHEDVEVEDSHTDTFRYRNEGAEKVILAGRKRLAIFANLEEEMPLRQLLLQFRWYDLVFLEGYFLEELPKIEFHREAAGPMLAGDLNHVFAICTDRKIDSSSSAHPTPPLFSFERLPELADLIGQALMNQSLGRVPC